MEKYVFGPPPPPLPEEFGVRTRHGLRNVIERIRLIYGEEYELNVESQLGVGTMMELEIEIRESEGYWHV
ncbi:hypothetical protein D3C73_1489380 [compost metagenome]